MRPRDRLRGIATTAPVALAAAAALAFLAAAAVRRLNFDEALALRSGWLVLAEIQAEPAFAMPFTIALGALGRAVQDPGAVFLVARIVVAGAVLAALLAGFWWTSKSVRITATATVLTLLQATFFVHGLEFRYDAALLVGVLLALPLLRRGANRDVLLLGAIAGWLALHHLKGVFLGAAVIALALARDGLRARAIRSAAMGAAGVVIAWIAVAHATGALPDALRMYSTFFRVGAGASERLSFWSGLVEPVRRDLAWWIAASAAAASTLWRLRPLSRRELPASPDLWALLLAALSTGILFLHPHAWAYMLALPAPFLAFLAARRWEETASSRLRAVVVAAFVSLAAWHLSSRFSPASAFRESFSARREPEVETLRMLRRIARPDDRILDPSGLAYFVAPCTSQWYVDTLFRESIGDGTWMGELRTLSPDRCPLALNTYRIDLLPKRDTERLFPQYAEAAGAIWLARGDPRLPALEGALPCGRIESFW